MADDPRSLDLSWVIPRVAVGGRFPMNQAAMLAQLQIQHVLDLRLEAADDEAALRACGIELLRLPTPDAHPPSLPVIRQAIAWIAPILKLERKVFIHCECGVGRSPLLACCTLVSLGYSPLEALSRVKDARPQASPSPAQLAALIEWAREWRDENALHWPIPVVDDLYRIAYRHLTSL